MSNDHFSRTSHSYHLKAAGRASEDAANHERKAIDEMHRLYVEAVENAPTLEAARKAVKRLAE